MTVWAVLRTWCGRVGVALACALGGAAWAAEAVPVDTRQLPLALVPHAQVLEDRSGQLDLAGAQAQREGWRPASGTALSLGISRSAYWVQWRLVNPSAQARELVIDLGQPRQDFALWHVLRDGGRRVEQVASGDRLPFSQQPLPERHIALPLHLAAQEEVQVWVRLSTYDGLFDVLPVTLHSRAGYAAKMDADDRSLMLFHGVLLALGLYNLLLFAATRQAAFGHYAHYIAWFSVWNATWSGMAWQHLWPQAPAFNNDFLTLSAAGAFVAVGLFALSYLRLREQVARGWVIALQGLVALNVVVALGALSGHYTLWAATGWATGLPLSLLGMGLATYLAWRGYRPARFYLLAFTLLLLGVLLNVGSMLTLIPTTWFTQWGIQIGSVAELLLLALGLADSLNTLKAEKLQAERRERLAQQALATRLEAQVAERTRALELANRRLHDLAITDELTGAFNRRHFNDFCTQLLTDNPRDEPLAFCMFDIDRFKDFNDRLGHQAGDEVLRAVVGAVQAMLRRSGDRLFRLGGEEFGVLFTARTPEHAHAFVERLRDAVRALHIQHPAREGDGIVTSSFGVVWWGTQPLTGLTRDELYGRADQQLYAAKQAGRDRVVLAAV